MKKILFLGAANFQIPPIRYALDHGYYVITADNVPENAGHKLAHKSFNVSTVDMEGILALARQECVDGIMTFGSDVSAPTAAYAAEKLGLPGNPYESVRMLTDKSKFRAFLNSTGLQPQRYQKFGPDEAANAAEYIAGSLLPVVIKPVDSAGSKGVSVVRELDRLDEQIRYAYSSSITKRIIVEDHVRKLGRQVCGDGFVVNGELVFVEFGDGHFYDDCEFLAPYAETFPGTHQPAHLEKVRQKLAAIVREAGFRNGPFNLDVFITEAGEPFIIELGPRSGGNYIPRAIFLNTGVDVVGAAVEICLDRGFEFPVVPPRQEKFFACYMIHSRTGGVLKEVKFTPEIAPNLFEINMYLSTGAHVEPFHKANTAIGNVILRFDSFAEVQSKMSRIQDFCYPEFETATMEAGIVPRAGRGG